MDNALTTTVPSGAVRAGAGADGFMARLTAVPVKAMVMLTLGVAALAAVIAALAMWSKSGDYRVLYANLSDKDGGAILAQLSSMNVPYKHAEGGNAILGDRRRWPRGSPRSGCDCRMSRRSVPTITSTRIGTPRCRRRWFGRPSSSWTV
jgi:hypothetical protein